MSFPIIRKSNSQRLLKSLAISIICCSNSFLGHAAGLTEIHAFPTPTGNAPYANLMQASDGNFYGTTYGGGPFCFGTVFRMTTNGTVTTLVTFNGFNGANPRAGLIQASDGNLYGTTVNGGFWGPDSPGTVFRLTTNGVFTSLYSFLATNSADGAFPYASLFQANDGNLYGTTLSGGTNFGGTVFQIALSGTFTTVSSLQSAQGTYSPLIQTSNGNFYFPAGVNSATSGGIMEMLPSGQLTNFEIIPNGINGGGPPYDGLTLGSNGYYFGTEDGFYGNRAGEIYKVPVPYGPALVCNFNTTNGAHPHGGLVMGPDNNFYGTTIAGGTNGGFGTVFKVTQSGTLTSLFSFSGTNGAAPYSRLIFGMDGKLYGTTESGGAYNAGTIFSMTTNGNLTTLFSFSPPMQPTALTEGADLNLYGCTTFGGSLNDGTIFEISANGAFTEIMEFNLTNGANPYSALCLSSNGKFYGTTYAGPGSSAANQGSVFSITSMGAFSTLCSFTGGLGSQPRGKLAEIGGILNGTLFSSSGSRGRFQVSYSGQTTYFNFPSGSNAPAFPSSSLALGSDDNIYGTSEYGGMGYVKYLQSGFGTVFNFTNGSNINLVVAFNGTNGANPYAGLTPASDGNLYGTTLLGGANNLGTIYQITTNGMLNSLVSFNGTNGATPFAGLIQGTDGQFYGTTMFGGSNNDGTLFRVTTNGTLQTLYTFGTIQDTDGNALDGAYPGTTLLQLANGDLYGTTSAGGSQNGGNVYRFRMRPTLQLAHDADNSVTLTWDTIPGLTYQLQKGTSLRPANWQNIGGRTVATNSSMTSTDEPNAGATLFYRVLLEP